MTKQLNSLNEYFNILSDVLICLELDEKTASMYKDNNISI